jgi:hypothetical protein
MKTIEIEIEDLENPSRPCWRDWVPEDELTEVCASIKAHGFKFAVCGPVSWQRQLAAMENPPL